MPVTRSGIRSTCCDGARLPPLALRSADTSYRLSPEDRARVVPGFDVDALERLLAVIRADMRCEILREFQLPRSGEPPPGGIMEFTEPALNPLLHEVWATMWQDEPDAFLEDGASVMPGRALERQRRQARKQDEPVPQGCREARRPS